MTFIKIDVMWGCARAVYVISRTYHVALVSHFCTSVWIRSLFRPHLLSSGFNHKVVLTWAGVFASMATPSVEPWQKSLANGHAKLATPVLPYLFVSLTFSWHQRQPISSQATWYQIRNEYQSDSAYYYQRGLRFWKFSVSGWLFKEFGGRREVRFE